MKQELKKQQTELQQLHNYLAENNYDIKVGDIFIAGDHYPYAKIMEIKMEKYGKEEKPYIIYYHNTYEDLNSWEPYGSDYVDNFSRSYTLKLPRGDMQSTLDEAQDFLDGKIKLDVYRDDSDISTENALVHAGSKENLNALRDGLLEKKHKAALIAGSVNILMAKKRAEMVKFKNQLDGILVDFQNKVDKLSKIIWTIELYLGINENIIQLRDGVPASIDSTIYFRQEILYMDEEVGDPEDDGLDFRNIKDFDNWIVDNAYKFLPESKSVTVFRVRREDKRYSDNPFINGYMNIDNKKTYILIINGETMYRVWADINILERLFPQKKEFFEIQQEIQKQVNDYGESYAETLKQRAEDKYIRYQQQLLMLQGLLDRTDVLQPYGDRIMLLSPEIHESKRVKFIYSDEIKLPDTRVDFWTWHEQINEDLKEGDRVVFSSRAAKPEEDDIQHRFDNRFSSKWSIPDPPREGLYQVDIAIHKTYNFVTDKEEELKMLCVRYKPGDVLYDLWGIRKRKVGLSYKIYSKDSFLINFDKIDLADVEFYLHSRVNRRHYLHMMPVLLTIKKLKQQEREAEEDFVKMVMGEFSDKLSGDELIWEAIAWWKLKNKWKRSLKSDDAKAYRMIKMRINKLLEERDT